MADIVIDNEAVPAAPASGKTIITVNSSTKQLITRDDSGRVATLSGSIRNWNTANVVATAADTYLTGSGLVIPTGQVMQVGTVFRWLLGLTRSGAGVASPAWRVRVGTAGTTADASRLLFTSPAQTGVGDSGTMRITAILRNVGVAGVLAGYFELEHNNVNTGLANTDSPIGLAISGGFDTTVAGTIVGVSVDPGSSSTFTFEVISAEALGI